MNKQVQIAATIAGLVGVMSLALPVLAFTPGACKDDEQKFCSGVQAGGGAIRDCMKQHQADLSQACKDNIAEGMQKMQDKINEVKAACKQELQQYCATVTPGQGRELACLKSYDDKLSPGCKEALPKMGMRKGVHLAGNGNGSNPNDGTPPPPEGK